MGAMGMADTVEKKELSSGEIFSLAAQWFLIAAFSFLFVALFHQFLAGGISYGIGYQTHIHIAKVESLPHYDSYWSTGRVLALYAFPGLFLLLVSIVLLNSLLLGSNTVTIGKWIRFWIMVFCVLMTTTLMSISFFNTLDPQNTLFQGCAVLVYWFRSSVFGATLFILVSGAINLIFGFVSARVLFDLMPILIKKRGKSARTKLLASFYYPVLAIFPLVILISFPHYWFFFVVMLFHAVLWLPGLYFIDPSTLRRGEIMISASNNYMAYTLLGAIIVISVLIRIFLS